MQLLQASDKEGSCRSGKTGKPREFDWSGKVRKNAELCGKS